uniref:Uncharacterized protein isoform X2 n=1 Tax=Nicotiana tabacum TaxID=4097 RepID=A0A1S3ZCH4_TOBAC|nr:PREDICTED: uncharacterized protein LOC107785206 isoform X2 [Nicotiana tabacum]
MGAGRKTTTLALKEKTKSMSTVNCGASARNLRKADLGAVIFGCTHVTHKECLLKQLFGLPEPHFSYVKKISMGLTLFLFNYSDRKLHGIFEAASPGQLNINPYGWTKTSDGSESTAYPAQVRIRVRQRYCPLTEDQFASIIGDNYYARGLFWFELDRSQTRRLVDLFSSLPALDEATGLLMSSLRNNLFKSLPMTRQVDAVGEMKDRHSEERPDHLDHSGWADASIGTTRKLNCGNSVLGSTGASTAVIEPKSYTQKLWSSLFKSSASDMDKLDATSDMDKIDPLLSSSSSPTSPPSDKNRMDWELCLSSSVDKEGHKYQAWDLADHEEPVELTSRFIYSSLQNESISPSQQSKLFERQYTEQESEHSEITTSELNLQQMNELKIEWESPCGESQNSESSTGNDNVEMPDDGPKSLMGLKEEERDTSQTFLSVNIGSEDRNSEVLEIPQQVDPSELLAVVAKLIGEVEGLKRSKLEQDLKIMSLEQELVHSRLELRQLMNMHNRLEPEPLYSSRNFEESVVIVGGYDGSSWLPSLDSYFPLHDRVETLSPMTFSRSHASSVKLNGEIFVLGGVYGDVWFNTVESFSPLRNQWIQQPSLNEKKGSLAGASLNDKIFAIGGGNGAQCFSEVEMFDFNIGNWISARAMMKKRFAAAAADIHGAIYVVGGYDGKAYLKYALGGYDGDNMVSSVEILDPRFGSWVMGEQMSSPRGYSGAAVVGGNIWVIGGVNDHEEVLDTIDCFEDGYGWQMTNSGSLGKRCFFSAIV